MGHTPGNRGVTPVPVGRKFALVSPVDCSVSISANPTGDALLNNFGFAKLVANVPYVAFIPAAFPPQFLSGITTDQNGDTTPTQLTFIDSGASGI